MFEKYNKIVIFDTETSSLTPEDGEIIELGAIVLSKPKDSVKFSERKDIDVLIKNNKPILNSHIHHITNEMCENEGISKESFFELLEPLFGEYDDILLVAYNVPFDMKFVKYFMSEMNPTYKIKNPVLDLLEVAKDRTGLWKGNKLCDMIVRYSIPDVVNSHRALDDCNATLEVMRAMFLESPNLEIYVRKVEEN